MIKKRGLALLVFGELCLGPHCAPPEFDLREPVYLVLDGDFTADDAENVRRGARMWYKHWEILEEKLVILAVSADNEVTGSNPRIRVVFDSCIGGSHTAEYRWVWLSEPKIAVKDRESLVPHTIAHELGHAFWTGPHIENRPSVMNSKRSPCGDGKPIGWFPIPEDILELCTAHSEIPCPSVLWCEGTFESKGVCPSSSPEEIEQGICLYREEENETETKASGLRYGTEIQ